MKLLYSIIVFLSAGAAIMLPKGKMSDAQGANCNRCHKHHYSLAERGHCSGGLISQR